ncbi:tail fiber domain-containing protein [Teredinibacter turnerae]|uniref:tail fiber domain-containing protein n=1 Tax=Teredinibacter turnerae TaxID=2426 RepID=UPI00036D8740|nr:tail fiber domain-containing protein [Teredinibacter turnerae]
MEASEEKNKGTSAGKGLRYSGGNWNKVAHIDSSSNLEGARGISFYGATNKTESDWRIYYAATGDNSSLYFYNDGNSVRHIFTDAGDLYADGEVRTGYSDERLKNDEGELTNALGALCQWKIFKYTPNATAQQWLNNKKPPQVDIGISAQSVEQHFPELVVPAPFDIGETRESITGEHYKTLRYERTVAVVAAALQQLATKTRRGKKQ